MKNISILAICGSLRAASLNRAALEAAVQLAPLQGSGLDTAAAVLARADLAASLRGALLALARGV